MVASTISIFIRTFLVHFIQSEPSITVIRESLQREIYSAVLKSGLQLPVLCV